MVFQKKKIDVTNKTITMFLKHNYFLILLSCFPALLFAQIDYKRDYNVANIPLDLLKNANVVVREHDLKFAVKNKGEAMETECENIY
jgi:hypothetical protein